MAIVRLGIIADTHYPARVPNLPYDAIEDAFRNVDAILHAGDIASPQVLHELSCIAPVVAVRGDQDHFDLPFERILKFNGLRLALTHGNRSPLQEEFYRLRRIFGYQETEWNHLPAELLARYAPQQVDIIVFGHTLSAFAARRQGIFLFNPGAVYTLSREAAEWQLPREKLLTRRRILKQALQGYQQNPQRPMPPSTLGILEISSQAEVKSQVLDLAPVDYLPSSSQGFYARSALTASNSR